MDRKIRVLIGKPGLDGHDRGAKIIARALRDAGMEVIYSGLHQTPEALVKTALEEDVDAIGLSVLSGAHNHLFPQIAELLRAEQLGEVILFGGGIIPDQDLPLMEEAGFRRIFTPGTRTTDVIDWLRAEFQKKLEHEQEGRS
jgi:methylmalonyl-CoA mutase C-terminal domain/subunit